MEARDDEDQDDALEYHYMLSDSSYFTTKGWYLREVLRLREDHYRTPISKSLTTVKDQAASRSSQPWEEKRARGRQSPRNPNWPRSFNVDGDHSSCLKKWLLQASTRKSHLSSDLGWSSGVWMRDRCCNVPGCAHTPLGCSLLPLRDPLQLSLGAQCTQLPWVTARRQCRCLDDRETMNWQGRFSSLAPTIPAASKKIGKHITLSYINHALNLNHPNRSSKNNGNTKITVVTSNE